MKTPPPKRFLCTTCGISLLVCDHEEILSMTITPQADAVRPLPPTLPDEPDLAAKLAREIMATGDEPGRVCHEIQFMGVRSKYVKHEIPKGGLCEAALADLLRRLLAKHTGQPGG